LLEYGGKVLGVAVDEVRDVLTVDEGAEEAAPETMKTGGATPLIRGLVQTGGGVAAVLDAGALARETLVTVGGDS